MSNPVSKILAMLLKKRCASDFFHRMSYVLFQSFESPFGLLTLEIYVFTKDCWKTLKMKWVYMVRPPPFFARWYFDEPQSNQQLRGLNCWLMSFQCTIVHSFYIHGMGNWVLFGMRPSFTQETWSSVASPTAGNGFKATVKSRSSDIAEGPELLVNGGACNRVLLHWSS